MQLHALNLIQWRWVDYWYPIDHVIEFKQDVYREILSEFEKVFFA